MLGTVECLEANGDRLTEASRAAAAHRLGMPAANVALVDSTTLGMGLACGALGLRPGQEMLSTDCDCGVTQKTLCQLAVRTGATMRLIPPFDRSARPSPRRSGPRRAA